MTIHEMYEATTAAQGAVIVFQVGGCAYIAIRDNMRKLPAKVCDRVDKQGNAYQTLRLDLHQSDKLALRDSSSLRIGRWADFIAGKRKDENIGEYVERFIIERYKGTARKAGTPYYEAGDALIAGKEIQIKFENATLARIDTIMEAWKRKTGNN